MTASLVPDRVKKLVLLVPAGVVTGPVWAVLTRMAVPLALYKLFPSERRKRRLLAHLFTSWDDAGAFSPVGSAGPLPRPLRLLAVQRGFR